MIVCALNASIIHGQDNKSSSVFNSVPLMGCDGVGGGDDSDLVRYCTEFIMLELNTLSASGGLPGFISII